MYMAVLSTVCVHCILNIVSLCSIIIILITIYMPHPSSPLCTTDDVHIILYTAAFALFLHIDYMYMYNIAK